MAAIPEDKTSPSSPTDDVHLLVIVHGLWGDPVHLRQLKETISAAHPSLHILIPKTNAGNLTYDGIEIGGERVTFEIEREIESLAPRKVTKLSITGYSLGGLIARYAIGLLYSKNLLHDPSSDSPQAENTLEPVNFTTFATPHLGVRTPTAGWRHALFNTLGGATLCTSGRQLFTIDTFRDTGRCLLDVLADPATSFMRGLALFRKRSLYANIVNDRAVPFYTAAFVPIDPFIDLDAINLTYDETDVLLSKSSFPPPLKTTPLTFAESTSSYLRTLYFRAPLLLLASALAPVGAVAFLANSGWQTYASTQRVRLHHAGEAGIDKDRYATLPLMVAGISRAAERVIGGAEGATGEDFLPSSSPQNHDPGLAYGDDDQHSSLSSSSSSSSKSSRQKPKKSKNLHKNDSKFPTLALTDAQFRMIQSLDALNFEKHLVHLRQSSHSHAAIVVRMERASFAEGRVVSKHWADRFIL